MASRRRLSDLERMEIVREMRNGISAEVLAKRFGVTRRSVNYTVQRDRNRQHDTGVRTKQVNVTLTPKELEYFDAFLNKRGISNRSDALRQLIQAANGIFQPDEHLADELSGFRGALNRVGNNVSQIAQRMNEAKLKGERLPFGEQSLQQMRSLAGFVLDFADQVDLLTRRRTEHISLQVDEALKGLADGEK